MTARPDVYLISTMGYALEAEISFRGIRLCVMDDFSDIDDPAHPGPLDDVSLTADEINALEWEEAFQGNPNREKKLVQVMGFHYRGLGQIVSINPTVVDLGVAFFELGPRTNDERCIGEFVAVNIDRLGLTRSFPIFHRKRAT
jgi:hypothetical protein